MRIIFAIFILVTFFNYAFAYEPPMHDRSGPKSDDQLFVGIDCNSKSEVIEIGYYTNYNLPSSPMDIWDTFDLKRNSKAGDYVEEVYEVVRKCIIGKDQYTVIIRPVPGNMGNLNGHCGNSTYGGAKISKNDIIIFDDDFEKCESEEIIANVKITKDQKDPVVTKLRRKAFYKEWYKYEQPAQQ